MNPSILDPRSKIDASFGFKVSPSALHRISGVTDADSATSATFTVDFFQLPSSTYPRQTFPSVCVEGEGDARQVAGSRVQFVSLLWSLS